MTAARPTLAEQRAALKERLMNIRLMLTTGRYLHKCGQVTEVVTIGYTKGASWEKVDDVFGREVWRKK